MQGLLLPRVKNTFFDFVIADVEKPKLNRSKSDGDLNGSDSKFKFWGNPSSCSTGSEELFRFAADGSGSDSSFGAGQWNMASPPDDNDIQQPRLHNLAEKDTLHRPIEIVFAAGSDLFGTVKKNKKQEGCSLKVSYRVQKQ